MKAWEDIQTLKVMIGAMPGNADLKRVVLEQIRLGTGGAAAQIFSQDLDLRWFDSEIDVGFDLVKIEPLRQDATQNILFTPERAKLFRPGTVLLSHEIVPDKEMERSDLYREFMSPLFFLMAAPLARCATSVRGFGVQRERRQGPFGERERRFLRELASCLIRAESDELTGRVAVAISEVKAEAFYTQNKVVILVDQESRILDVSHLAEKFIQRSNGMLFSREGRIASRVSHTKLRDIIRTVASSGMAQSIALRREGPLEVSVELRRIFVEPSRTRSLPQIVALYVNETTRPLLNVRYFAKLEALSKLSRVEQEIVARMIVAGESNKEIAAAMHVNDVRALEQRIRRIGKKLKINAQRGTSLRRILSPLLLSE